LPIAAGLSAEICRYNAACATAARLNPLKDRENPVGMEVELRLLEGI
jgi:hypothetical protein